MNHLPPRPRQPRRRLARPSPPRPRGARRPRREAPEILPIALGLALLGAGGALGPSVVENVTGATPKYSLTAVPADAPAEGLIYDGLQPAKADSLCAGAYALDARTARTGRTAPRPACGWAATWRR